jgi:mannose-6-phosphate isomerase-like protein (cupin superfamily)
MGVITAPTDATHDLGGTRFMSLATPSRGSTETSVWTVEIEPSTPATPHRLTREEVFVVLAGRAHVQLDRDEAIASVGDAIVVPAGSDFVLSNGGAEILRLLCCLPVGGQAIVDGTTFTPPWAE